MTRNPNPSRDPEEVLLVATEFLVVAKNALRQIGDMSVATNQGSAEWRLDWCGKKAAETLATLDGRNWRDG